MKNKMLEDFTADKMVSHGVIEVDVTRFNGMMAICICDNDDGAVLITKEQAMKFFDLKENK